MAVQRGFHEPGEKPRRFYKAVDVADAEAGFEVRLDGRPLRTPKGEKLVLPTRALADQIAGEWAGQGEHIEAAAMHATRLANTAVAAIPGTREAVADQIAEYAGSDLLHYFADGPSALTTRQEERWGPVLALAEAEARLRFVRATGVVHQPQPAESLARVKEIAVELNDFQLAGLAFGAALFGSAVLAIAVLRGWLTGEQAFELSRLDEAWQNEQWGVDDEAAERTERLRGEAVMLERWFRNCYA